MARDFIKTLGPAFLPHLLRRLSDEMVEGDKLWHAERGLKSPPRTASTLLALDQHGNLAITELAKLLNQSHQLVQQWIAKLLKLNLICVRPDPADARRSLISLTDEGRAEVVCLKKEIQSTGTAICTLVDEVSPGLIEALWMLEDNLRKRSLIDRIREVDA